MAGIATWVAAQAAKAGKSANQAYEDLHAAGEGMRRSTFLRLYAQVQADLAQQANEITAPLESRPHAAQIRAYDTKTQSGYMQYVDVYVRDRATGAVYSVPYGHRTDDLLSRADVIETALFNYGTHAEEYDQQVLGATYTSTYMFIPGGV